MFSNASFSSWAIGGNRLYEINIFWGTRIAFFYFQIDCRSWLAINTQIRRSRESGNPVKSKNWITAFAGMTTQLDHL